MNCIKYGLIPLLISFLLYPAPVLCAKERFVKVTPRSHEFRETALYLGSLYALSGVLFFILSNNEIMNNGSFHTYVSNLGQITVFDNDSPNANWITHVYTGSQTFLFYRARSYTKTDAFLLTALQSALFEFTIEIIQEPASFEDLVNTPVIGSTLGLALEYATIPMLNSDSWVLRVIGNILNPTAFLGLNEGELKFTPVVGKKWGIALEVKF